MEISSDGIDLFFEQDIEYIYGKITNNYKILMQITIRYKRDCICNQSCTWKCKYIYVYAIILYLVVDFCTKRLFN